MTNKEIDAAIGSIVPHEQEMHRLIRERAIFRAGMEHAAKICERAPIYRSHRNQRVIDYMAMGALVCRDAIRAAANAPPEL